jgi:hypothetical protein
VPAGIAFQGAAPLVEPVKVLIGEMEAKVLFAGLSAAGLYQLNVQVPNVGDGDQRISAEVAGMRTQESAFITISSAPIPTHHRRRHGGPPLRRLRLPPAGGHTVADGYTFGSADTHT